MIEHKLARNNPFATARLHALKFRLPAFSWEQLDQRLASLCYRAAIVGPHGSGKTQFLEELMGRLEQQGHHVRLLRLHARERSKNRLLSRNFVRTLTASDSVLLDGAEQLGSCSWWRFVRQTRACRTLLITVHRPCRLPTLLETAASIELLDELLVELLGAEADAWQPMAHELFRLRHGNIREVWRDLYEAYAANRPFAPRDIAATIFHCLGYEPETQEVDQSGRPFAISQGHPIWPILS